MRVDVGVCRAKYTLDLECVRSQESVLNARGIFLVGQPIFPFVDLLVVPRNPIHVSFPVTEPPPGLIARPPPEAPAGSPSPVLLMRAQVPNLAARAFKVRIDLSDYDMRAPSVTFLDPWTSLPLKYNDMFRALNIEAQRGPHLVLLDSHPLTKLPFLCVRGVREYHEHPQHTGDSWLLYRGSVTLFSVLMTIWRTCIDIVQPHLIMQPNGLMVNWEAEAKP